MRKNNLREKKRLVVCSMVIATCILMVLMSAAASPPTDDTNYWSPNSNGIHYNDGNVGIGTATPDTKLTVSGDIALAYGGELRVINPFPYRTILKTGWDATNGDYLRLFTPGGNSWDANQKMTLNQYGNVGIGTDNPSDRLEVVKTDAGAVSSALSIFAKGGMNPSNEAVLKLKTIGLGGGIVIGTMKQKYFSDSNNYGIEITPRSDATGVLSLNGNVGIGTSNPTTKLEVRNGDIKMGYTSWTSPQKFFIGTLSIERPGTTNDFAFKTSNDAINYYERMRIAYDGKVGIGTTNPNSKLEVAGTISSTSGGFKFPDGTLQTTAATTSSGDSDWVITVNGNMYSGVTGNVGIGTSFPTEKLQVAGTIGMNGFKLSNGAVNGYVLTSDGTGVGTWKKLPTPSGGGGTPNTIAKYVNATTLGNSAITEINGNVGIGTSLPDAVLTVKGTVSNSVLFRGYNTVGEVVAEIGEGLDYAESFTTSDQNISPGSVVILDSQHPGALTISNQAYDRKVAGVISGAKGLSYGVRLGSTVDEGSPVALAGRVYCNVDTSYGEITVGDLLTTSPTPGYAMVVKDYSRAQGSILGKAMEPITVGQTGQILILVTLQ
jgi:hypothetical protein